MCDLKTLFCCYLSFPDPNPHFSHLYMVVIFNMLTDKVHIHIDLPAKMLSIPAMEPVHTAKDTIIPQGLRVYPLAGSFEVSGSLE